MEKSARVIIFELKPMTELNLVKFAQSLEREDTKQPVAYIPSPQEGTGQDRVGQGRARKV